MQEYIETERLILRPFEEKDVAALFSILADEDVNTFLPMFPLQSMEEAKAYLQCKYLAKYVAQEGFYYAICLKGKNVPVGYVHVNEDDSHDLGYGLKKDFWHKGLCREACSAMLERVKRVGIPYVTATHDVKNPRSGNVMQSIGMKYQYSYEELWQPKNIPVTFRMYQLNLDGRSDRVYKKYWNKYPHFIETDLDGCGL